MPTTECSAIEKGLSGNTIAFLKKNVIKTDTNPEKGFPSSASRTLDFDDAGQTKQGGRLYSLTTPNNSKLINGLLTVSYLPWGEDTGYYIVLEPKGGPDIMMTATLSGCAVGYLRAGDGAVRVSHHNVQSSKMDFEQKNTLGFTNNTLHNSDYRYTTEDTEGEFIFDRQGLGFVFGVRRNKKWTMYYQKVEQTLKSHSKIYQPTIETFSISGVGVF